MPLWAARMTTKTTNTTAGYQRTATSRSAPRRSGRVFLHTAPENKTASCYGDGDDSREEGNGGDIFASWKGYSDGGCQYWTTDEPYHLMEHPASSVRSWRWDWVSIGLIVDTCHDWVIRRMCILTYKDWGVHAPDGRVYHAGGSPQISKDCSMKNELAFIVAQLMTNQFRDTRRKQGRDVPHGPGSRW